MPLIARVHCWSNLMTAPYMNRYYWKLPEVATETIKGIFYKLDELKL